ncbi:unnamed protein product [Amoebophrya sp. A120]|nr:unnamed protein product [Amoebophrya sp. A120]|eukprot:GSA120T00004986001.1
MTQDQSSSSSSHLPMLWPLPLEKKDTPATASVKVETMRMEPYGRGFFTQMEEARMVVDESVESEGNTDEATPAGFKGDRHKPKSFTKAGIFKLDDNLKGVDLYKFLQVKVDATEKDLKKAFRDMSLVYHPDKQTKGSDEQKAKEFVKLQEAYDILSDPVRRRKYDSSLPFDDTIPKEKELAEMKDLTDQQFYDIFHDVFQRNSKWSLKQPVPQLPAFVSVEEGTPEFEKYMKKVTDFYKFWTGDFESWRDFDMKIIEEEGDDALDDPDKSEYREEKRYIERQNARIRQKYRNDESARLLTLAELAEKYDSRIKLLKQRQWEKKNEGKLAKQRAREEEERKKKEEKEAREREEKEAEEKRKKEKEAKEEEKNKLKVLRRDLRALAKQHAKTVSADQFQSVLLSTKTVEETETLLADLTDELARGKDLESGEALVPKVCALIREQLGEEPVMCDPPVENAAAENNTTAFQESAPAKKQGGKKNNKKKNKNQQAVDEDDEPDARAEVMEQKIDMEQEAKRQADAEKKRKQAAEKRKQEEAQRKKAEEAAKKKEQDKARKEAEKEKKAQEEQKAKAEEMRKKHQEEAAREKAAAEQEKLSQVQTDQYIKQREEQLAQYDNECNGSGLEAVFSAVKAELAEDVINEAWIRAGTLKTLPEGTEDTLESRAELALDVVAFLASKFTKFHFFEVAVRPTQAMSNLSISSSLRNKIKKARTALSKGLKTLMPPTHQQPDAKASKKFSNPEMDAILSANFPPQSWQVSEKQVTRNDSKGEQGANADSAKKPAGKKKKPAKKDDEEDLDALFAEFGVEEKGKKKKAGKK